MPIKKFWTNFERSINLIAHYISKPKSMVPFRKLTI